jgi:hypothetical protein
VSRRYALDHLERLTPAIRLRAGIAARALRAQVTASRLTAGARRSGWTLLGPSNVGGRMRALLVDRSKPSRLWLGSAGGGIWVSNDRGATWSAVQDFDGNVAVTAIVQHPDDPAVLFAGTGEGFGAGDGIPGTGLYRSGDAGATWRILEKTITFRTVNRLAIARDPSARGRYILLAATGQGLFFSEDLGASWLPGRLKAPGTPPLSEPIGTVLFHPTDSHRVLAGGLEGGMWRSEDGGRNWTVQSPRPGGRVELTYAAQDPRIVYASVNANGGELWIGDSRGSFTIKRTGHLTEQGDYSNAVWAGDPTNSQRILLGGDELWESKDGGRSVTKLSPSVPHVDLHVLVSDPSDDGKTLRGIYVGSDGGLHRLKDFTTWERLNNGLAITQFYGVAASERSGTIIGGTQDNGTLRLLEGDGPDRFWEMAKGDGGYCAADPKDHRVFYGENPNLRIHRSTDGGKWSFNITGRVFGDESRRKPRPYLLPDAQDEKHSLGIAPFALDPNDGNRLFAGGLSLWRTEDAKAPQTPDSGPRWSEVHGPLGDNAVSALAIAPWSSNVVWVGHANGAIFKTSMGRAPADQLMIRPDAWEPIDDRGTGTPARAVTAIAVDPRDANRIFVGYAEFVDPTPAAGVRLMSNVWRRERRGVTYGWKDVGIGLPVRAPPADPNVKPGLFAPVRAIAIHPADSNRLYVGSEVGLFESLDGGDTWTLGDQGPASGSVRGLTFLGHTLIAATHGRGLWSLEIPIGRAAPAPSVELRLDPESGKILERAPFDPKSIGGPHRWYRWFVTPSARGQAADVAETRFRVLMEPRAGPAEREVRSGERAEVWVPVGIPVGCGESGALCAPLSPAQQIVRTCADQVGKVSNAPDPADPQKKTGWERLVEYHKGSWKSAYNPAWLGPLQKINGWVRYPVSVADGMTGWAPYFATWCVAQYRKDVSWLGDGIRGLGAFRKDVEKADCGDIVVTHRNDWGVVSGLNKTQVEVITGYVGGVRGQRVERQAWDRKDVALFYPALTGGTPPAPAPPRARSLGLGASPRSASPIFPDRTEKIDPYRSPLLVFAQFPAGTTPPIARIHRLLEVPRPTVDMKATPVPAETGRVAFRIEVTASGFAGAPETWNRRYFRNGVPLCALSPFVVDFALGEKRVIEAMVADAQGVETRVAHIEP